MFRVDGSVRSIFMTHGDYGRRNEQQPLGPENRVFGITARRKVSRHEVLCFRPLFTARHDSSMPSGIPFKPTNAPRIPLLIPTLFATPPCLVRSPPPPLDPSHPFILVLLISPPVQHPIFDPGPRAICWRYVLDHIVRRATGLVSEYNLCCCQDRQLLHSQRGGELDAHA
jgi:hypothetical protein